MIERISSQRLKLLASQFPVLLITGPRQAGKTTLARWFFAEKPYVSLENLDTALRAREDPRGFLEPFAQGVVLDEVQRVPELLSYLQQMVDEDPAPGRFILTGSQQFSFMGSAVQSLAGRAALLELLPFSLSELRNSGQNFTDLDKALWQGWYPPIHDRSLDPALWYEAYISTYLERDVRQVENIRDLAGFRRFLLLAAGRTGQLLNLSAFAADCGVSHNTIKAWISILEASYLIKLVQPYHRSFNKRITKTPKLFFLDTGLAARLLGILNPSQLASHPLRGALFETFVFGELLKRKWAGLDTFEIYFWRDHGGHEIDFVLDKGLELEALEVKSGATFHPDHAQGLLGFQAMAGGLITKSTLVYGGREAFAYKNCLVRPWSELG